MTYAVVWSFAPEGEESRVVIGHPGTFSDTAEEAREEGRRILDDLEKEEDEKYRNCLKPLATVAVDQDIGDDIQEACEEVEAGDELLFYDLDNYARWQKDSWWPA